MKAELVILGVLHRGNCHPYEIKRRLTNAMIECYTDIDVGTLYYAIRQLAQGGLIEPVSREQVARGGARTVYRITAQGKQRFQELLHGQFEEEGSVADTLYGAMLFLHLADPLRLEPLLRAKIERQTRLIEELDTIRVQMAPVLSTGGRHIVDHLDQQRRLDRKWLKAVLADVSAGRIADVADPAGLGRE